MNHVVVFRLQLRAAIDQQELDERIEKRDIALGGFQREGIDARAVFADTVYATSVEFNDAFIAAADVEDVREATVFLLQRDGGIADHTFARSGWSEDEHHPHSVHIYVLKEGRPCARLEDVQVLVVQVL